MDNLEFESERVKAITSRIQRGFSRSLDIDLGWLPIVFALDEKLVALDPNYTICQVKEKFGSLRVYAEGNFGAEGELHIEEAERLSLHTCEACGYVDDTPLCRLCQRERAWIGWPDRCEHDDGELPIVTTGCLAGRFWIHTYCAECRVKFESTPAGH